MTVIYEFTFYKEQISVLCCRTKGFNQVKVYRSQLLPAQFKILNQLITEQFSLQFVWFKFLLVYR